MRARGAEKRRRYRRTPELPGPGKFRSNRDAVTARDGLRQCCTKLARWRQSYTPGGELRHVKPHGMLYNRAAKEPPLADAIARAVRDADADTVLVGLAGSELIRAGQHYQLTTRREVFADRGYLADGSPGAA